MVLPIGSAIFGKERDVAWAFLEGLFRHAPLGIAFYDCNCRYVQVNTALAIRNGAPASEHIGKAVRDVVPPEAAGIEHAIACVLASGAPIRVSTLADVVDYYPVRIGGDTIGVGAIVLSGYTGDAPLGDGGPTIAESEVSGITPRVDTQIPFESTRGLDGASILVIDDDADTRELLVEIISSAGGMTLTACSAEEALAILRSRRADIIVCDVAMPDRDGYSFLRELRSSGEEAGAWTPAIALTGYASARDSHAALLAGFQMHLPKPVGPPVLLESLVRLWRRATRDNTNEPSQSRDI